MGLVFRGLGRGEGELSVFVVSLCGGQGSVCYMCAELRCEHLWV
jgi:hypothetical protein